MMEFKKTILSSSSAGQTMIETLVAIFILVTGVTSALGLAVYALSTSTGIVKQIVATGLAREGLEAVKQMRDTNWLRQTTIDKTCYNYNDGSLTAWCYKNWLNKQFCIDPSVSGCDSAATSTSYFLSFDSTSSSPAGFWVLAPSAINYGLKLDQTNSSFMGFYNSWNSGGQACSNAVASISDYCRKITITKISNIKPYLPASSDGPLVLVQSYVWWIDKNCPRVADWNLASKSCRLEMDSYLTNWKDY